VKRQFAYLMVDRINYRDIEEIQAATPLLYELSVSSNGTNQPVKVHRIGNLGDQDFVLQEVMPGHLEAYTRLIDGYSVVYEEVSFDDAPNLAKKHRERLMAECATLCRRIPCPPPAPLLFAKANSKTSNTRPRSPAPQLDSGPLKHQRSDTDNSTEATSKRRAAFEAALRGAGTRPEMPQIATPTGLPMNAATTILNLEEMYAKLDRIAAQQNAASSDNNAAEDKTAVVVPIYDADGVFVMYDLPENAGTNVGMYDNYPNADTIGVERQESPTDSMKGMYSGSPNYAPYDEGVDMGSPDEGLLMRGRDSGTSERGNRERAPNPERRRGG
jgi:hypothetical protein